MYKTMSIKWQEYKSKEIQMGEFSTIFTYNYNI